jgi:multidrug efflux system membrane fusion protein
MISNPTASPPSSVSETKVSETNPIRTLPPPERRNGHTPSLPEPPHAVASSAQAEKRSHWGWIITLTVLAAISAACWYYQATWLAPVKSLIFAPKPEKKAPPPIPVLTAVVKKRDMDLYLNGLGTVTALKTVTIRSRVEGELVNIAFSEGQMVHDGQLLAEIDTRPFVVQRDQALGNLARDKAALDIANLNLDRLNKLLPSKAVTQQQVEEQIALVKQTEGTIKSDEAMVANAELQLTYCKIISPITGRIGLRLVDVGNYIRANDPTGMAVITQLEPIALVFTVPQDEIPRVQKRMREGHVLTVDAYDRDFQVKIATGNLTAIDNQVDPTTGTLRMKATFEKNDNLLFPNQFVNTRMLVDTRRGATIVPSAAVQRGPNSTYVYLVKSDETVEQRTIEVGPTEGAGTAIESGLVPGDIVVTDGVDKLKNGTRVTSQEKAAGTGKGKGAKGEAKKEPAEPVETKSEISPEKDSVEKSPISSQGRDKKSGDSTDGPKGSQ